MTEMRATLSAGTRQAASKPLHVIAARNNLLQRKCACGGNSGVDGECEACRSKRLLRKAADPAVPAVAPTIALTNPPRWRIGDIPIHPKLTIGAADSPLEHEADRVADQIMRSTNPTIPRIAETPGSTIQRAPAAWEEVTALRRGPGNAALFGVPAPPSVGAVLGAPGRPLDPATRSFFQSRFGRDLGGVRIHTDAGADAANRSIGARAFTVADHIAFARGEYAPDTHAGRALLAHELTHVVQQGAAERAVADRAGPGPTIRRASAPVAQRATRKGCVAPSFVVDVATASVFGIFAEALINIDYIRAMGGTPFGDVFLDNPLGQVAYVAFLAAHHPSLNMALLAAQIGLSGGVLVPDILDTRLAAGGMPEFYDVKPDSPDGRAAGRGKLAAIDAFMSFNKLPYSRGSSYTPAASIPIPLPGPAFTAALTTLLGPAGASVAIPILACGMPVVTLAPKRIANGLIAYQICVEADLDCNLKVVALEVLIAAIILAALATGGASVPETVPALVPALTATDPGAAKPGAEGLNSAQAQPA